MSGNPCNCPPLARVCLGAEWPSGASLGKGDGLHHVAEEDGLVDDAQQVDGEEERRVGEGDHREEDEEQVDVHFAPRPEPTGPPYREGDNGDNGVFTK